MYAREHAHNWPLNFDLNSIIPLAVKCGSSGTSRRICGQKWY